MGSILSQNCILLDNIEICYNFMQTPFSRLRREQKIRRERLNQSLSPVTPNLSLSSERQRSVTRKLSNSSITSRKNKLNKPTKTSQKTQQKDHYQVYVKQTLRKTFQGKNEAANVGTDGYQRNQFSLVVCGSTCGQQLLKQRRQKLEKMILQIKQNNLTLQNYDLPQVGVKRSKYIKGYQPSNNNDPSSPTSQQPNNVNPRDFLICQPCQIIQTSSSIASTHETPFYPSKRRSFLPLQSRKQVKSLSTCRKYHKTSKNQQIINSISPRLSRKHPQAKQHNHNANGFDMNYLNGWQSTPDKQELWQPWPNQ